KWLLDAKGEFYNAIRYPEFTAQIAGYLATIGPDYPKSLDQMIERTNRFNATRADGARPNPSRWSLFKREADSGTLNDYRYTSAITGCHWLVLQLKAFLNRKNWTPS